MKNKEENYLDNIPCIFPGLPYKIQEDGKVIILLEHHGFFQWIAQKVFHKPKITNVHLDKMGNFIWPLCDGTNTIYDISKKVKEEFGEDAEPLYVRLVQYLKTLESNSFIKIKQH